MSADTPSKTPRCDDSGFEVWTREWGNIEVMPLEDGQKLELDLAAAQEQIAALKARIAELESAGSDGACGECDLREKMSGRIPACPFAWFYDSSYHSEWHFVKERNPACTAFQPKEPKP